MGELVEMKRYIFETLPTGQLLKKNIMILDLHNKSGRIRALCLEKEFWIALEMISSAEKKTLGELINSINRSRRSNVPLAACAKVFVVSYLLFEKTETYEAKRIMNKISHYQSGYEKVNKKKEFLAEAN